MKYIVCNLWLLFIAAREKRSPCSPEACCSSVGSTSAGNGAQITAVFRIWWGCASWMNLHYVLSHHANEAQTTAVIRICCCVLWVNSHRVQVFNICFLYQTLRHCHIIFNHFTSFWILVANPICSVLFCFLHFLHKKRNSHTGLHFVNLRQCRL